VLPQTAVAFVSMPPHARLGPSLNKSLRINLQRLIPTSSKTKLSPRSAFDAWRSAFPALSALLLRRWVWLGFAAATGRFVSATTPAWFVSATARMIHRLIVLRSVARTGATLLLMYDFRR
jgi:hypothetical protein